MPLSLYMSLESLNSSEAGRNVSTGNTNLGRVADDTETTKTIKTVVLSALIATAVFGNVLVIASVYANLNKRMRVVSNYLVVNLSIADMFLAIFCLSRLIMLTYLGFEWPFDGVFGEFSCKAHNFFIFHLLFVSTMNFMAIAIDRFVAVFFPLSAIMKGKLLYFVITATWIIPGCFFAFYWKMMKLQVRRGITVCFADVLDVFLTFEDFHNFQTAQNVVLTGITLAITVGLYVAIGVKLTQRRPPGNQQEDTVAQSEAVARHVVRMMVTVVMVFCMCWSPLWILSIICKINPRHRVCGNPNANFLKFVIAYSNSAITPFIYPINSSNFRASFKRILGSLFCCKSVRVSPQPLIGQGTNEREETAETQLQRFSTLRSHSSKLTTKSQSIV